MFNCYCSRCEKVIKKDEVDYEVDLVEVSWGEDWEHVHLKCGGVVSWK